MIRAMKLKQFANGDLFVPRAHHYEGPCGCCCDKDEARKCFFAATVEAGASTGAANGDCSNKRWLTMSQMLSKEMLGMMLHRAFPRTVLKAFQWRPLLDDADELRKYDQYS